MPKYRLYFNGRTLDIQAESVFTNGTPTGFVQFLNSDSKVVAEFSRESLNGYVEVDKIVSDKSEGTEKK